jgi:hypothetical protein
MPIVARAREAALVQAVSAAHLARREIAMPGTDAPGPPRLTKDLSTMTQLRNRIEHRWGERIRVDIPVQVSSGSAAGIRGRMRNLSLSGALMKCDVDLRLHTLIEVRIELPLPSPRMAELKAHISRKFNADIGIEWCEFAPRIVTELLRL